MPRTLELGTSKSKTPSFYNLLQPIQTIFPRMPALRARGNRPLYMDFEHQLKAFILYHLEKHTSGSHLMHVLDEDSFARKEIAPHGGIKKKFLLRGRQCSRA